MHALLHKIVKCCVQTVLLAVLCSASLVYGNLCTGLPPHHSYMALVIVGVKPHKRIQWCILGVLDFSIPPSCWLAFLNGIIEFCVQYYMNIEYSSCILACIDEYCIRTIYTNSCIFTWYCWSIVTADKSDTLNLQ